jgi:type I restriction enzyme R subunit
MGWELEDVEKPFVTQLQGLGWTHIEGSIYDPAMTGRTSFTEVIQEGFLRAKLAEINLREADGAFVPWLDEGRISEAVAAITRIARPKLSQPGRNGVAFAGHYSRWPARLGWWAWADHPLH